MFPDVARSRVQPGNSQLFISDRCCSARSRAGFAPSSPPPPRGQAASGRLGTCRMGSPGGCPADTRLGQTDHDPLTRCAVKRARLMGNMSKTAGQHCRQTAQHGAQCNLPGDRHGTRTPYTAMQVVRAVLEYANEVVTGAAAAGATPKTRIFTTERARALKQDGVIRVHRAQAGYPAVRFSRTRPPVSSPPERRNWPSWLNSKRLQGINLEANGRLRLLPPKTAAIRSRQRNGTPIAHSIGYSADS